MLVVLCLRSTVGTYGMQNAEKSFIKVKLFHVYRNHVSKIQTSLICIARVLYEQVKHKSDKH